MRDLLHKLRLILAGVLVSVGIAAVAQVGGGSGTSSPPTRDASLLVTGELVDDRLSANVPLLDGLNTFTATQTISAAAPTIRIIETDEPNGQFWQLDSFAGHLRITARDNVGLVATVLSLPHAAGSRIGSLNAYKTASTLRASTIVLADDPDLLVSLGIGRFVYEAMLGVSSSGLGDLRLKVNSTGGTSTPSVGTLTVFPVALGAVSARGFVVGASVTGIDVNGSETVHLSGSVNMTTAGVLSIQWAQSTSDVNAVVVAAGSWLRVMQVAE